MSKRMKKPLGRMFSAIIRRITVLLVLQAMTVLAFMAALVLGLGMIRDKVTTLPEYCVNVNSINIADRPAWAPKELGHEIRSVLPARAGIFDRRLPRKVYNACKALYWVDDITYVKKIYPNTLEIQLKLRTPVAYVMHGSIPYLCDNNGTRLPNNYYREGPDAPALMLINGVAEPPPAPGGSWQDIDALMAGLTTVQEVSGRGCAIQAKVTTVDVSNYDGRLRKTRSHIVLWTESQTQILWGRSSDDRQFDDLTAEEKLVNLDSAVREYGDLENMEYISVYSHKNQAPAKYRKYKSK